MPTSGPMRRGQIAELERRCERAVVAAAVEQGVHRVAVGGHRGVSDRCRGHLRRGHRLVGAGQPPPRSDRLVVGGVDVVDQEGDVANAVAVGPHMGRDRRLRMKAHH